MRFNVFIQKDSSAYGALVCSVCNKNVALELEKTVDLAAYGDGSRAINVLGSRRGHPRRSVAKRMTTR